ncbi:MAG: TonB-dependent receptor, partial [Rhodospirillaceae bacterium]|nr:TonB-dependent receptor [Rhodospirillaceae bacterium]
RIKPGTKGNLGGHDKDAYFIAAALTPTESLTIDASYYHFDISKEFAAAYTLEEFARGLNCAPIAGINQLYCGRLPVNDTLVADPRSYGLQSKSNFYRGNIDWKINDQFTATYLVGRVKSTASAFGASNQVYTTPGTIITFLGTPNGDLKATSHEVRLAYDDGQNIKAMGGIYYFDTTDVLNIRVANLPALQSTPATVANSTPASGVQTQLVEDWAGFGELSVDLMDDRLNVTLQGRYSEEEKETRSSTTPVVFKKKFKEFAPRVSVQYQVAEESLVYASAARGTKSGGFNATVFVESERAYGPDTNWTYELGTKNRFLDDRLQINGALFYTKWANLQVGGFPSNIPPGVVVAAIVLNSGAARAYGLELEAVAVVTDNLTVNFGGSIADPKFKQNQFIQGGITGLCDNVVCARNGDVSGNLLPRQSKEQFNAGFTYEAELAADWTAYVRGDVAWQSSQPLEPQNLASIAGRTVANASVGAIYGNYELQLWAKNLFDETYISGSNVDTGRNNTRYTPTLGASRTVGVTARARF